MITLITAAAAITDGWEQVRIGGHAAISKDHGRRDARIDPPTISRRLHVNGLGQIDEDHALELVAEILTGIVELRRLHDQPVLLLLRKGENGAVATLLTSSD